MKHISLFILLFFSLSAYSQESYTLTVQGACGMCEDRIEETALSHLGVIKADWNSETLILTVEVEEGASNNFSILALHLAISEAGHSTDKYEAPQEVYNSLPTCCQYNDPNNVHLTSSDEDENETEHHIDLDDNIVGSVFEILKNGDREPLIGANLVWQQSGIGTTTDSDGTFTTPFPDGGDNLIVSYIGFHNDTLIVNKAGHVEIELDPSVMLKTVNISYRKKSTEISYVSPIKISSISSKELTKAACCSLSESFETTSAVDVGFADAVTGLRTIQMLGLAGPYVQITREGQPDVRGIASLYGMEYTPGPWIESIQLNQGAGSVVSGYEGIAGQINVELAKPYSDEKLYINGYANQGGRYEGNMNYNTEVSESVATALLVHGSKRTRIHDRNDDTFIDMPLSDQFTAVNRWKFLFRDGWVGQAGVKITTLAQQGGQIGHEEHNDINHISNPWLTSVDISRQEGWIKSGLLFNENKSSLALQLSASNHTHKSSFGNTIYDAWQQTFYANVLFQQMIDDEGSYTIVGASFTGDHIHEHLGNQDFDRFEEVPGVWAEYNYLRGEKLTIVPGIRLDHHNIYGWFTTPRLHVRYAPTESTVIRLAAGRGQKTASVIAENIGMLASNRTVTIEGNDTALPYGGLDAEVAWNYGINLVKDIVVGERDLSLQFDGYFTDFTNQIIVDYDEDPRLVKFYNLDGRSTSLSLQTLVGYNPIDRLDIKVAYRYNDVKADYESGTLQKPLIAAHRTFANIAYETTSGWKFDYTINRIGSKRLPSTAKSPENVRRVEQSPAFFLSNAQISKVWDDKFEIYIGGENLFNYRQEDPITSAEDTSSPYFDASQVWGPIFGANIYVGFRHKLFNE